ncbi:TPA: hypothetical protein HMV47_24465 [Escherichia coli]|nr:hypothetical protein [Escherichia coli]
MFTAIAPAIWGSTYIVTTQYLPNFSPMTVAMLRALPAGLLLVMIVRQIPTGIWWMRIFILGALNISLFWSLLFISVYRLPVVVPVTSGGNFARTAGFAVSLDGVGIRTTGVVRCDQPRTIDMKARGGKRLERVPETIMNEVLGRLSTILT